MPAIPEDGSCGVFAFFQQRGDIVHIVLHALGVIGPAGAKHIFADYAPVQVKLIKAERGGVKARRTDLAVELEFPTQIRRGDCGAHSAYKRRGDPLRLPIALLQKPHLPCGHIGPVRCRTRLIPYLHFPMVTGSGFQRFPCILHVNGGVALGASAVPEIGLPFCQEFWRRSNEDAVGALANAPALSRWQHPAEEGLENIQADGIYDIFATQGGGLHENEFNRESGAKVLPKTTLETSQLLTSICFPCRAFYLLRLHTMARIPNFCRSRRSFFT